MITQLPCKQKRTMSALAGFLVAYMGYDRAFEMFPEVVHHALAGIAVDATCRGADVLDGSTETLTSAALGGMGGALAMIVKRGSLKM